MGALVHGVGVLGGVRPVGPPGWGGVRGALVAFPCPDSNATPSEAVQRGYGPQPRSGAPRPPDRHVARTGTRRVPDHHELSTPTSGSSSTWASRSCCSWSGPGRGRAAEAHRDRVPAGTVARRRRDRGRDPHRAVGARHRQLHRFRRRARDRHGRQGPLHPVGRAGGPDRPAPHPARGRTRVRDADGGRRAWPDAPPAGAAQPVRPEGCLRSRGRGGRAPDTSGSTASSTSCGSATTSCGRSTPSATTSRWSTPMWPGSGGRAAPRLRPVRRPRRRWCTDDDADTVIREVDPSPRVRELRDRGARAGGARRGSAPSTSSTV